MKNYSEPTIKLIDTDCALRLLQGISSITGYELRLNTVRCMPYRPHPLRFSVSITYQKERKKCSFLNSIEFSGQVCYHTLATRSSYFPRRVCVFTLVKTQARISHTLWGNEELCVAAMGLCVFRCVASATHFLFRERRRHYGTLDGYFRHFRSWCRYCDSLVHCQLFLRSCLYEGLSR